MHLFQLSLNGYCSNLTKIANGLSAVALQRYIGSAISVNGHGNFSNIALLYRYVDGADFSILLHCISEIFDVCFVESTTFGERIREATERFTKIRKIEAKCIGA